MTLTLICLPHSGAGASAYRAWRRNSTDAVRISPVQLPGRDSEIEEPLPATMDEAAAVVAARIRSAVADGPYAVFGHSLGAILAFEAVHRLTDDGFAPPSHVFASGSGCPPHSGGRRLSDDDQTAVEQLRVVMGGESEALEHEEVRELVLPILRADFNLLYDYRPSTLKPLPAPVTVLRGSDDALVPERCAREWADFTTEAFRYRELAGGHMYVTDSWAEVWTIVEEVL